MARFSFRQGIARRQEDGFGNGANLQPSNGGSYIDLLVTPDPTVAIVSHYDVDYMITENASVTKAWGPFIGGNDYWLYWDVDFTSGELIRGFTTLDPVVGSTPPSTPQVDQHWYDSDETVMKVWSGSRWTEKIRVFACKYQNGASIIDLPIGSQVSISGSDVFAGAILYDPDGNPLQKFQRDRKGRFITTESEMHSQFARIANFRVEAAIVQGEAREHIPIHHCVTYYDYNELELARNTINNKNCIGLAAEDMYPNEVRSYITKGFITNEVDWDWSAHPVGTPLFVGPTGELVTDIPLTDFVQQVAIIINETTIFVDIKEPIDFSVNPSGNLIPLHIDRNTGKKHAKHHDGSSGGASLCDENAPINGLCSWGYHHEEATSEMVWVINHGLSTSKVVVNVFDDSNFMVIPAEVVIVDINTIQVYFAEPMAGTANIVGLLPKNDD